MKATVDAYKSLTEKQKAELTDVIENKGHVQLEAIKGTGAT